MHVTHLQLVKKFTNYDLRITANYDNQTDPYSIEVDFPIKESGSRGIKKRRSEKVYGPRNGRHVR